MLKEDNSGFVNFPIPNRIITRLDTGKTFVYLVAFDTSDLNNKAYELSNIHLFMPGSFVSDDIIQRPRTKEAQLTLDDLIEDQMKNDEYDGIYFPNFNGKDEFRKVMSIPMTSSICIGWSEYTFELKEKIGFWNTTFRDLTNEGRKLYYSIKK